MYYPYTVPVREDDAADFARRLGVVLLEARELARLTRPEVAAKLEPPLASETIARYERGESTPSAWVNHQLARLLDIPPKMLDDPPETRREVLAILTHYVRDEDVPPEIRAEVRHAEDEVRRRRSGDADPEEPRSSVPPTAPTR